MKKLLIALVLVALGAAGITAYHLQTAAHGGASATAVNYLPPETVLFLSAPDLNGTVNEWKTTDLYKIWTEPEVQAFLEKPLSRLPPHGQFNDTLARIGKLAPKNLFIALTTVEEKTNRPHVVAGFEFTGASTDVDTLLAEPKNQLRQHFPTGKANLLNYQGHPIETFDAGDGNMIASLYVGDWYLVGNDLPLLQSTVDRVEKRAPASDQPSLAKDADFQSVMAKLPSGHATLIFGRAQGLMKRLYDLAAASGQAIDETQRAAAEKLKAVGATTRIENGKLRDTIYCLAPGYPAPPASLQMSALPLASMDTVLFSAWVFKLPARLDLPADAPAGSPGAGGLGMLKGFASMLEAQGLTLAKFDAAFGHEASVQIDWAAKSSQPKLIASLDVRDHAAADKFLDSLTKIPAGTATWQTTQSDGLTLRTLAAPGYSFVNPTLTLSDKHLILGLNPPEVHDAAKREGTNTPNFTQGETYKTAAASVEKANLASAYLDSRAFFERLYGTLKPLAMFGTAFVPQAGDYVDLGKLPSTESISKHLSPTVTSESVDGQGILFESVGSFTGAQAVAVTAGAVGAAAIPLIEKQFGALPGTTPTAPAQPGSGE